MGHRGCAKSTLARAFREILPAPIYSEMTPFVEVPLGTSEDRLLGSIDASSLLENGKWSAQSGLIEQANGGVLYIDEVNLLPDHLVDSILDSAASGQHRIERDGLSQTVNARYILIGSMNPEEIGSDLIESIAYSSKICHHLHISLQSGDEKILKMMGRAAPPGSFSQNFAHSGDLTLKTFLFRLTFKVIILFG